MRGHCKQKPVLRGCRLLEFLWACCVRSGLVIALGLVNYTIWLGEDGFGKFQILSSQVQVIQQDNRHLESQNKRLQGAVQNIASGGELLERQARENLNMIGPGEKLFKIMS